MNNVSVVTNRILPSTEAAIERVRKLEEFTSKMPQSEIETYHTIHAGMYSRTIKIPKGTLLTGALIKIPTLLIMSGDAIVFVDNKPVEMHGYNILPASAHRKQAFLTLEDTYLTMVFPTKAKTVKEAEEESTDDSAFLLSRKQDNNTIIITGE